MTDEQDKRSDVRRVSPRDRKRRIESRDLSFPPDSLPPETLPDREIDETQPYEAAGNLNVQAVDSREKPRRDRAPSADRFPQVPSDARRRRAPVRRQTGTPSRRARLSWRDGVAVLFLVATLLVGGYFVFIWNNPYSPLNPLSPPLPAPIMVSETPLPSATYTPSRTPTRSPTATFTPLPAGLIGTGAAPVFLGTPDLTQTLLAGTPSATPPPPPFALLRTGVVYTTNANGLACNYVGIAGSVVDFEGSPLNGYTVWITGENVDSRLVTGSDNLYGAGGFVLQVGDTPAILPFAAQVLAQDGVTPLSEPYTFLTRDVCEYNVALVRFVQVRELPGG